jgi:hypothetical protein
MRPISWRNCKALQRTYRAANGLSLKTLKSDCTSRGISFTSKISNPLNPPSSLTYRRMSSSMAPHLTKISSNVSLILAACERPVWVSSKSGLEELDPRQDLPDVYSVLHDVCCALDCNYEYSEQCLEALQLLVHNQTGCIHLHSDAPCEGAFFSQCQVSA